MSAATTVRRVQAAVVVRPWTALLERALVREDVGPMGDLRFERFSDPAFLAHLAPGEQVPNSGWAITHDGDVFCDGVQAGRLGKYVFNRASGTPYGEIAYEGLDGD